MNSQEQFRESLEQLQERIKHACDRCGRSVDEVELMAVTKTHPVEAAQWAIAAGLRRIGENRVQEAAGKRPQLQGADGAWELIGPLQSNKARLAVETVDRIQTVDRIKLVRVLDRICGELGKETYPVLMQVNVGDDPAKHGCSAEEADQLVDALRHCSHLKLEGLMTIGQLTGEEKIIRTTFSRLRNLRARLEEDWELSLPVLSMGMTDDLELAIEEGSTLIRVGTALYGSR